MAIAKSHAVTEYQIADDVHAWQNRGHVPSYDNRSPRGPEWRERHREVLERRYMPSHPIDAEDLTRRLEAYIAGLNPPKHSRAVSTGSITSPNANPHPNVPWYSSDPMPYKVSRHGSTIAVHTTIREEGIERSETSPPEDTEEKMTPKAQHVTGPSKYHHVPTNAAADFAATATSESMAIASGANRIHPLAKQVLRKQMTGSRPDVVTISRHLTGKPGSEGLARTHQDALQQNIWALDEHMSNNRESLKAFKRIFPNSLHEYTPLPQKANQQSFSEMYMDGISARDRTIPQRTNAAIAPIRTANDRCDWAQLDDEPANKRWSAFELLSPIFNWTDSTG